MIQVRSAVALNAACFISHFNSHFIAQLNRDFDDI